MGPGTAHEECAVAALRMMEAGLREAKPLVRDHTAGVGVGGAEPGLRLLCHCLSPLWPPLRGWPWARTWALPGEQG